jgi:putative ABC transport system ATP-binding protein
MQKRGEFMQTNTIVHVQGVHKELSNDEKTFPILHNINLSIRQGEWVSLVGPSGSGKTTLLGIMAGIDRPTTGKVFMHGQEISSMREGQLARFRNQQIGIIFQSFFLISSLTALENVAVPLFIGKNKRHALDKAADMLAQVGLSHRLNNRPHQLSGGEQQRVAIARALVTEPAILYADEPTGNLDSSSSQQLMMLLHTLRKRQNLSLMVVTHDNTVAAHGDRVLHLYDGMLVDRPASVASKPSTTNALAPMPKSEANGRQ